MAEINNLEEALDKLSESNAAVWVNGQIPSTESLIDALIACPVRASLPDPNIVSAHIDEDTVRKPSQALDIKELLRAKHEQTAQAMLQPHLSDLQALDSSRSTNHMFNKPRRVCKTNDVYPATAVFDLTSELLSMAMEITGTNPATSGIEEERASINSDVACLAQALDCIHVVSCTDATLKTFVLLAVTARSAWVLRFDRALVHFGKPMAKTTRDDSFEQVSVDRIAHGDVWKLWNGYQRYTVAHPQWFRTRDAHHILSTLQAVTDPFLCATRLIAKSKHNIYGVSLPKLFDHLTASNVRKKVLGVTLEQHDFCIKVVNNYDDDYAGECAALTDTCRSYNELYPDKRHHFIASCFLSNYDEELTAPELTLNERPPQPPCAERCTAAMKSSAEMNASGGEDAKDGDCVPSNEGDLDGLRACEPGVMDAVCRAAQFLQQTECREPLILRAVETHPGIAAKSPNWRVFREQDFAKSIGGTFVMRMGKHQSLSKTNMKSWLRGVFQTLAAIHRAGYVHCDIRASNVMMFQDDFQVIDMDHAQKIVDDNGAKASVTFKPGEQYDMRPPTLEDYCIKGQGAKHTVQWTVALDLEMAAMCTTSLAFDAWN